MMNGSTARRLRQLLPATLGAVVIPVGGAALGLSPIAGAQPGSSWDVGAYHDCLKTSRNTYQCCIGPGKTCTSPLDDNRTRGPLDDLPIVGNLPGLGGVL
jgi:hypothetical protein